MARRIQFRLRAIFYATAIAAVLCLILPPLFRIAQRHFATKRPLPKPIHIEILWDFSEMQREPTSTDAQPNPPGPSGATFVSTTIVRVNGKRVDAIDDVQHAQQDIRTPE